MEYEKGVFKTAVISAIKLAVPTERITAVVTDKSRFDFSTVILNDQKVEISIKYHDNKLLLVSAHLPKIRFSIFFVPIDILISLPETIAFAGKFGRMRV